MEPIVSVRQVNHSYGSGSVTRQILFDASAEISSGEIVILRGPSGAGKTTLLTLIGALRSLQGGSIRTLGQELLGAGSRACNALRRQIGFIFQSHNLLDSLTLCQNVQTSLSPWPHLFTGQTRSRSIEALAAVGLEDRVNDVPRSLSGGQKQKVAIARALVRKPKLILADEPTAALDSVSGRDVVEILHRLARKDGCAILLVTHDSRILDVADRILNLEDGRLSTFTSGIASETGDLLTAFAELQRKGDLVRSVRSLDDSQFISFLERATGDFERLLQGFDAAHYDALRGLVGQVLEAVTIRIRDRIGAESASLFLLDREARKLWSLVFDSAAEKALRIEIPIGEGIVGTAASTGQPVRIEGSALDPHSYLNVGEVETSGARSVLCMPIRDRRGEIIAVARFLNKQGQSAFTTEDVDHFEELARPMGIILESCRRLRPA